MQSIELVVTTLAYDRVRIQQSPCPADLVAMNVKDIMTVRPRTILADKQLHVAQSICKWGDFRHLPVVDGAGKLLGVVSVTDVLRASDAERVVSTPAAEREQQLAQVAVTDVMRRDPVVVDPSMPVDEAARCMMRERINCLPVVEAGELVGIVTSFDMLGLIGRSPVAVNGD